MAPGPNRVFEKVGSIEGAQGSGRHVCHVTPVAGVKVFAHHPTTIDFIEYFDARKAWNGISGTTFWVQWCVRLISELSRY
jgi:hypothetical protein